jgi:hypothetical protein
VPCKNEERAKAAFASWRDMNGVLVISTSAWKTAQQPIRAPDQHDKGSFTLFRTNVLAEKTKK